MMIYTGLVLNFLFTLFPVIAYYLIYKKFRTKWTGLMFYSLLFSIVLEYTKQFFTQGFSATYSETGVLLSQVNPSMGYMYLSYASGILQSLSIVGLLLFAIDLHKPDKIS